MIRRLSLLLALGLGCIALAWGLFSLHGIFVDERDDALGSIGARRSALEQYAAKELERRLRDRLAELTPTMDAAAHDPLLPADGLWLVDRGRQILPRTARPAEGNGTPGSDLYHALRSAQSESLILREQARDATSPFAERLMLFEDLKRALGAGDRAGIETAARRFLAHKASYVLVATQDIPLTLAALAELSERATVDRSLMQSLLRDGLDSGARRIEGLERALLLARERFSRPDLERLRDAMVALCERSQVIYADFSARIDDPGATRLALPSPLEEPMLVEGGRWYLEPPQSERVRGVTVDLPATLAEITQAMRERALLGADDRVVPAALAGSLPLSGLELHVESPAWQPAVSAVHERYRLKAALELVIAALVFGLMGLGAVIYRRRHRFLELKSDFVSAVSHELRTPLASIRLMAETLERRTRDVPRVRDYPARIVRDIDGLSLLVENILSFNRLSRGRWTPKLERVRLEEVVDKLAQHQDSWATKPAELEAGEAHGELVADADLLQLLLTNLARNAVQYCEREPARVRIAAERLERGWRLTVRDNGVGIAEAERDRVFDDFYRSREGSGRERGSGLGLAICRKIMEAHGGSIRIAESGPGGTTFELRFPDRAPVTTPP